MATDSVLCLKTYLRTRATITAMINAVVNVAVTWFTNRQMESVPLSGIVTDTAITSIVMSLLMTLFAASGVRRELRAARLAIPKDVPHAKGVLALLPQTPWALGMVFGVGIAIVLVSLTLAMSQLIGIRELPFVRFAMIKAAYTGLLGFGVTRWVVLRQVLQAAADRSLEPPRETLKPWVRRIKYVQVRRHQVLFDARSLWRI